MWMALGKNTKLVGHGAGLARYLPLWMALGKNTKLVRAWYWVGDWRCRDAIIWRLHPKNLLIAYHHQLAGYRMLI